MKKRTFETEHFLLEESLIDSSGDAVWSVTEKHSTSCFYIHVSNSGLLYITFFKKVVISTCPDEAIKFICEEIISRNLIPTIKIKPTNTALIRLCKKVGFYKVRGSKFSYVFNKTAQWAVLLFNWVLFEILIT